MFRRLAQVMAASALILGGLTGCSDEDGTNGTNGTNGADETGDEPTQSPTSETSEPEEPYLPVPAGVELTDQGSELGVGESAVIAWQPRQDLVGVLDLNVTRLERTTFAESFEGWDVKAEQKKKVTPYFVRARVTNVGDTNLSGRLVPLYAMDSAETLVEPTKFTEEFKPCPGGTLPKGFSTDDRVDVCMVYLIAAGEKLTGVTFRPIQDFDAITWTGEIQRIQKPEQNRNRQGRGG